MKGEAKSLVLKSFVLFFLVAALTIIPLVMQRGAEFGGADGQAEQVIAETNPGYEPWFRSFWEPPGGEVESLLFTLQAAAGSGFIGYYLGYVRGKGKRREQD